jgi:uncharacterized protein YdcH (DUF465 family)
MLDRLRSRLKYLEHEHAELDKRIDGQEKTGVFEDATIEVLKKQRLHLKDEIVKIQLNIAQEHGNLEND